MHPTWVKEDYNSQRDASYKNREISNPLIAYLASQAAVGQANVWHHWDFLIDSGSYRLVKISSDAFFLNYVAVGAIDVPNQPTPVALPSRYAVVHSIARYGNTSSDFKLAAETLIRVEFWAQHYKYANSSPLPSGFNEWIIYVPTFKYDETPRHLKHYFPSEARVAGFGTAYRTVAKMEAQANSMRFFVEDGPDIDFDDMVISLERL
jgi:hypothetical protein